MARKANPNHKMLTPLMGFAGRCSCGWNGATWYGTGSRREAIKEWHWHRERCEQEQA